MDKKYLETVNEAKDLDDGHAEGKNRREAEIAYESLAAATSMGLFGSEQELTELIELQLAKQLQYHMSPDAPHSESENEEK